MATTAPYPTLTEAIAKLRQVVYFKQHLKQQLGMDTYYLPGESTRLVGQLVNFLGMVNLQQQAFPLEPVAINDQVDVKHLPSEMFDQTTTLIQDWFPLVEGLEEGQTGLQVMPFYQDWWEGDWYRLDAVIHVVLGLLNHAEWDSVLETFGINPDRFSKRELPIKYDLIDESKLKELCQQQDNNTRYLYDAVATMDNHIGNYFFDHYDMVEPLRFDDLEGLMALKQDFQEALTLTAHRNQLNEWLKDSHSPEGIEHKLKALVKLWNQARKEGEEGDEDEDEEEFVQLCLF